MSQRVLQNLVFKWANPGLFLFIFVHYKHKFYRKAVGFSRIRTRNVEVEGEHADHLNTTAVLQNRFNKFKIQFNLPSKATKSYGFS